MAFGRDGGISERDHPQSIEAPHRDHSHQPRRARALRDRANDHGSVAFLDLDFIKISFDGVVTGFRVRQQ